MRTAGIDPGIRPGIAVLTDDRIVIHTGRIGSAGHACDEHALRWALKLHDVTDAVVELVGPMPGQGLASTSHFMTSWGLIRGVLTGLGITYTLVPPQVWKVAVLPKSEIADAATRKKAQKAAAVTFVRTMYPDVRLVLPGCRVPDHNIAEAVCLAHYGMTYAKV